MFSVRYCDWYSSCPPAGRLSAGPEAQFLSGTRPLPSHRPLAASKPGRPASPSPRTHLALSGVHQCRTSNPKNGRVGGNNTMNKKHCILLEVKIPHTVCHKNHPLPARSMFNFIVHTLTLTSYSHRWRSDTDVHRITTRKGFS